MRRFDIRIAVLIAVMALIAAACGDDDSGATTTGAEATSTTAAATTTTKAELKDATLRVDWTFLAYHTPFLYAQKQGYYEEEGINLEVLEGQGSGSTVTLVGTGEDTFGFADTGTTMLQRSQGVPVKSILVIWRTAGFGTACFDDVGFTGPKDLEGKTVLIIPQESTAQIWPAYLQANGVDESKVTVQNADFSNKISLFADHQADCMAGYVGQDTLISQLINPEIADPIPWSDGGILMMGHGLIASDDTITEEPEMVAGFVRASIRGWEEVCADPSLGTDLYFDKFPELSDADREFNLQSLPLECAKLVPLAGGTRLGETTVANWQAMLDLLTEVGGLEDPLPVGDYYTNDFLP